MKTTIEIPQAFIAAIEAGDLAEACRWVRTETACLHACDTPAIRQRRDAMRLIYLVALDAEAYAQAEAKAEVMQEGGAA